MRITAIALAILLATATTAAAGDKPWRLGQEAALPDWLTISGETRMRYETLDGQFRAGGDGGDQLLLFRTLLFLEADTGPVKFGFELQDSRTYLGDRGTPLGTSIVNPLDILQVYMRFEAPGLIGADSKTDIILGRQTVSIGSKRQIERVDFANVIKNYTGLHAISSNARGDELHLLFVTPVARFPGERDAIDNNRLKLDREQLGRKIWALHYRRADIAPMLAPDIWGEAFIYGLNERDKDATPTPNRQYVAPGFRLYRAPKAARWDMDIEAAMRFGERRATSAAEDVTDLDVRASMAFIALGYTFDAPWRLRIALEYYWASGDDDPNDDRFDQHERLFGSRRTDLNNTSIHGPLTPANLSAPGLRLEAKPAPRMDGRIAYSAAFLASATDAWVIAKLRDPTGASGRFIGHTIDGRARYWLVPDNLRLEIGASALFFSRFAKTVPGGPTGDATLFGYAQATLSF